MTGTDLGRTLVGVGAVVLDPLGRILLVRRGNPPGAGLWSLPGGGLEPEETLADCCRREVREETGIAVEPGAIVAVAEVFAEGFRYVVVDFLALPVGADTIPRPASDALDARWFLSREIPFDSAVGGLAAVVEAAQQSMGGEWQAGLHRREGQVSLFLPLWPRAEKR